MNEMHLSILEFIRFCRRSFGESVEEWWMGLDEDRSGEISFDEWEGACINLGFFGAIQQVFNFIDKDDGRTITFTEFKELHSFTSRPAPI